MQSIAKTANEYMESLPEDRRQEVAKVREVILKSLPEGYREGMDYGMLAYFIPLEQYPETYNGRPLCYVGLAAQKNYLSLYMLGAYTSAEEEERFREAYVKSGKKLNMGKSCVRFKKADDLALEVIADTIASKTPDQFIAAYEHARPKK